LGAATTVSGDDNSRFAAARSGSASGYCQLLSHQVTYMLIPVSEGDDKVHRKLQALHCIDMCLVWNDGKDRWDDEGSHSIYVDLIYLSALTPPLFKS
jgi:hypothetical protein